MPKWVFDNEAPMPTPDPTGVDIIKADHADEINRQAKEQSTIKDVLTSDGVKRWSVEPTQDGAMRLTVHHREDPDGCFVYYSDYAAMFNEMSLLSGVIVTLVKNHGILKDGSARQIRCQMELLDEGRLERARLLAENARLRAELLETTRQLNVASAERTEAHLELDTAGVKDDAELSRRVRDVLATLHRQLREREGLLEGAKKFAEDIKGSSETGDNYKNEAHQWLRDLAALKPLAGGGGTPTAPASPPAASTTAARGTPPSDTASRVP